MKTFNVKFNVKETMDGDPIQMAMKVNAKNKMEAIGIAAQKFTAIGKNNTLFVSNFVAEEEV